MKTRRSHPKNGPLPRQAGFTLVELLTVMVIMALLATAIPAIESMLQSTMISQAGQTLVEQVSQARQMATARDITVQVRMIKLAQVQTSTATGYNAIQLWGVPSGSSQAIALARMTVLPTAAVISEDSTTCSKLLTCATITTGTMTVPSGSATYSSFSITPSGVIPVSSVSTGEAASMGSAYLSIVPARLGATTTALTGNYVIVQMNPDTGNALLYRP